MEQPPRDVLIDAALTGRFHNVVTRFLDGKWELLPSVWNVSAEDVLAEGKRRGIECYVLARPASEGYWLSEAEDRYVVQFYERGTNSDKREFNDLADAFRYLVNSQLAYFQLGARNAL